MDWKKISKKESDLGTDIRYQAVLDGETLPLYVDSRKRHIPRANGKPGTWDHTSYHVILEDEKVREKAALSDAKEYAEKLWEARPNG